MTHKDITFCASPNCKNKCGRRLSTEEMIEVFEKDLLVSYINFCDKEGELIKCV